MPSNIEIQQKVLDGTQTGPVTVELDIKDLVGTVELEDSLLDKTGSSINIEVSDNLGVTGLGDLLEIKNSIDASVRETQQAIADAQRQIDKANDTLAGLDAATKEINVLVDAAKKASTTAQNKAVEAGSSATESGESSIASAKSAKEAQTSANSAEASKVAAEAANKATQGYKQDVATILQEARVVEQHVDTLNTEAKATAIRVAASETAAKLSETKAKDSETATSTSETNAKLSETNAKLSETNAISSEHAAKLSSQAAKVSETSAKDSEVAAKTASTSAIAAKDETALLANSAKLSETASTAAAKAAGISETNAKLSETNSKASEVEAAKQHQAAESSAQVAKQSERNTAEAEKRVADSENVVKALEKKALESKNTAVQHAEEAKISSYNADSYKTDAENSASAAKASEVAAEEWATTKPNNSAKYWASKAKEYTDRTFISGGPWTPTDGNEYPDVTGTLVDTIWKITFPVRGDKYTFKTGVLAGKKTRTLDELMYDMPTGTWTLYQTDTVAGITSIETPIGGVETGLQIEITPQKLGALTKQIGNALYLGIDNTAKTAAKLQTAFKLMLTGDASGTVSIDGAGDATLTVTVHDNSHAHSIDNVTGLQNELDAKVSSTRLVNGRALSTDITLTPADIGALPANTVLFSGDWNDLQNKPAEYTPKAHSHTWGQITDKPEYATRWAKWSEVTEKPDVAIKGTDVSFGTINTNKEFSLNLPYTSGDWAKGLSFLSKDGSSLVGGIGMAGTGNTPKSVSIGVGSEWWKDSSGLTITETAILFKGQELYSKGNKPTPSELDVYSKSEATLRFLGSDAKAKDADKVDGVSAERIPFGSNGFATTRQNDLNINRKSGFVEANGANKPGGGTWFWGAQISHTGNGSANKYGAQWGVNQDGNFYFRAQNASGIGTWRSPYHEGNKPTPAELGVLPASTTAADIGARPDTWNPTWNDVQNKPATFTPAAHTHGWGGITGKPATATRWPTWNEVAQKPAGLLTKATADTLYFTNSGKNTSSGMKTFYTSYSKQDDHINSPISIRERSLVGQAQSSLNYAPSINFHWGGRASKSLLMGTDGLPYWGDFSPVGVVTAKAMQMVPDYYYTSNGGTINVPARKSQTTIIDVWKVGATINLTGTGFKKGDTVIINNILDSNGTTTINEVGSGVIYLPDATTDNNLTLTGRATVKLRIVNATNFVVCDIYK